MGLTSSQKGPELASTGRQPANVHCNRMDSVGAWERTSHTFWADCDIKTKKSRHLCISWYTQETFLCFNLQRGAFNLWMDTKIAEIYTSFDKALDISLLLCKWHKSVLYFQELTYILFINFIKWNVYSCMLLLSLVTLHVIYLHAHMHLWRTAKKLRFYFTWNLTCHSWGEYKQKTQHHRVRDKENCWKPKKNR